MKVPSLGLLNAGPCRFLHTREHHPLMGIGGLLVRPDVPIAIRRILRGSRLAKPRMGIGGVIDDEIDDHANAALPAAMGEFDKVAKRAVARVQAVKIRYVVDI